MFVVHVSPPSKTSRLLKRLAIIMHTRTHAGVALDGYVLYTLGSLPDMHTPDKLAASDRVADIVLEVIHASFVASRTAMNGSFLRGCMYNIARMLRERS